MNDRFMAHGNTLWSPSGAGGENDICQLLGPLVTIPSTKCFWLRGVRFKENLQLCQELATCSTCPEQIKNLNHLEYFGVV